MLGSSARVAHVIAALASVLASSADEGRNIILSMLVVGLIFLAVILLGDLNAWRARKRHARRR
jgi:heme/copper-type cytochrome/quinol oxidase subunit 2